MNQTLTAIVPFYNEQKTLQESVERLVGVGFVKEIILVDDCSTDSSIEVANLLKRKHSNIKLLKNKKNSGKGQAINTAKEHVKTTHVIIHDADLEYFPEDIQDLFSEVPKSPNSLILGSRFIGTKKRKNIYRRTLIANKAMSLFFSLINLYKVSDIATCYKLFPNEFFQNIALKERGFSIEVELLSKFLKYNKRITEVPIGYEGRSYDEGKKIKTSDGFYYLINTIKYRLFN